MPCGHEHDEFPHPFNGHKAYLTGIELRGTKQEKAMAHSALYIGTVLECILYELQRQGARLSDVRWWPDDGGS